ncbi:hypothetical protein TSAR_003044 [Trichomalopsis sarcophagae]|uniref:Uncharacterized protein n=1 Tax=Trichomalopsis sarcophagae TaxID=543379 RepID=A0A232FHI2_9HYME|nr:hypothetical protein TSAR_003044 [Trichomalopsis sarcophagae]
MRYTLLLAILIIWVTLITAGRRRHRPDDESQVQTRPRPPIPHRPHRPEPQTVTATCLVKISAKPNGQKKPQPVQKPVEQEMPVSQIFIFSNFLYSTEKEKVNAAEFKVSSENFPNRTISLINLTPQQQGLHHHLPLANP